MRAPDARPPFKAEAIHILLRDKALKGANRVPSDLASVAQTLAEILNFTQRLAQVWNGSSKRHHDQCKRLAFAFAEIVELLPAHRQIAAETCGTMRWENQAPLAVMDGVIAAVAAARATGLPLAHHMNVMAPAYGSWLDIASGLKTLFQAMLPKCSDAAAYRFIEAVVPNITGEKPSFELIKNTLAPSKLMRLVNRGGKRL
jgi:uncharacterized protein YukE